MRNAGDIFGASVSGDAGKLSLFDPHGELMLRSTQDASFIYPESSPLPGDGNATLAYVVDEPGTYAIAVADAGFGGSHDLDLKVFRQEG